MLQEPRSGGFPQANTWAAEHLSCDLQPNHRVSFLNESDDSSTQRSWLPLFRYAIAVVVAAAIGYTIWKATGQLCEQSFSFAQIHYGWWALAVVCYVGSMLLSAAFWHRTLVALQQRPKFGRSIAAFCISQLGKYVPGKAMVVVMRTDHIRGPEVSIGPAVASVFVETLTWLFTGSAIASLLLVWLFDEPVLQAVAVVMTIVAGLLTAPPTLRWIANRMGHVKGKKTGKVMLGLTTKTILGGWALLTVGWCLNGLSLWLVL